MPQRKRTIAQKDAEKRYREKMYQTGLTMPLPMGEEVRARAALLGKSVNAYVTDLIWRDLYGENSENGGKAESSEKARKAEKAESYQKEKQ